MNRRGFLKGLLVAPIVAPLIPQWEWPEAEALPAVEPGILSKQEALSLEPIVQVPPGTILSYVGEPMQGWLPCDGRAVGVKEYPALYAAIGTAYGAVDTSYRFKLPDMRVRSISVPGNHSHSFTPAPLPQKGDFITVTGMTGTTVARNDHNHSMMMEYIPFGYMIKT